MKKIYVKFGKQKSIAKFLEMFFETKNSDFYSLGAQTYKDPEFKFPQCHLRAYRSYDDIFDLVNTYYKCDDKKLIKTLLSIKPKNKRDGGSLNLYLGACSSMRKIKCYYTAMQFSCSISGISQYNSRKSWKELFSLVMDVDAFDNRANRHIGLNQFYEQNKKS